MAIAVNFRHTYQEFQCADCNRLYTSGYYTLFTEGPFTRYRCVECFKKAEQKRAKDEYLQLSEWPPERDAVALAKADILWTKGDGWRYWPRNNAFRWNADELKAIAREVELLQRDFPDGLDKWIEERRRQWDKP